MSAFPPHRSIPSIPISQEVALKYLSSYLSAAKTEPYLQPNARLEQSGPTFGSSTSSVTMHNLQRVEAGLRGEWLAPIMDLEEGGAVKVAVGMDDGVGVGVGVEQGQEDDGVGWQDLEEYQREQDIEEGEVGARMPRVVQEEGDGQIVEDLIAGREEEQQKGNRETVEKSNLKGAGSERITPIDKEARKREKKAKRKRELRQKSEAQKEIESH